MKEREAFPPASPRDRISVARERARGREINGREERVSFLPPLLVIEIPSRDRERGGEREKREEKWNPEGERREGEK